MIRIIALALFAAVAAFMLTLIAPDAECCAYVPRSDRPEDYIRIAEESAIIVWDPVKKIEHFIRRAAFDTPSPDFGFLVPTPTVPELKEVEDRIFREMDDWIAPTFVRENRFSIDPILCCFAGGSAPSKKAGAPHGVRVLDEQIVGGFKAAILEADNTQDLSDWLKNNGYSSDAELQSWLVPYVANKWKITAFKIMQDPKTGKLATTKPVRMSFATERPFFPYREPEGKPEKKGLDTGKTKQKEKHLPTEIDGIWKVESAEGDGKDTAKLLGTKFRFEEGVAVGRFLKDSKYMVDSGKEPKWLDVGKMQGIYKLDGDALHWCRGTTARPGQFDSNEGSLLVLRRDKKAEADDAKARSVAEAHHRLHGGARLLRVSFVSNARMEGTLGNTAWHAKVTWADELTSEQRTQLATETGVAENDLPPKTWLTTFEDRADPRPAKEEVYFNPSPDQTPIRPVVILYSEWWIPLDVVFVAVALVWLVWLAVARRRARS